MKPHLLVLTLALLTGTSLAATTPESCRDLRRHGHRNEATSCFTTLSQSNDAYLRAEGLWGLKQYDAANEAFRQAATHDAKPIVRVRWGLLLHDRFNNKEAVDLFNEALQQDPNNAQAYLGLATVSADGFDSHAEEYAHKAAELDPKSPEPHELLANIALANAKNDDALAEADKALALSSDALDAMAIHAAVDTLNDRTAAADIWFAKIRAINPNYGEGYALVAYHMVLNRRYPDGVAFYRKAIAADPELWPAHSQLGINLMRLGEEEEPMRELELAYNNGQRDAATVNSLRLLDSYKNFITIRDDVSILRLRKNEADLLRPYFQPELHKILTTYTAKYGLSLMQPVQVEVYPDHEDFAVRTLGMPGLGALGVTFGQVLAMDSPSGRKPGEFNWGSTLWHEMDHVYVLTITQYRVPRWFAEGIAVHEEGQASPEWSNRATPEILLAYRAKKLLPVADMDQGFIYPKYSDQVLVSYFEAGQMCDYIQERWGAPKLVSMVHSFAARKTTPEVIRTDLGIEPAVFDKDFMAWLDKRIGAQSKNFDTWRTQLKALDEAAKNKQNDVVLKAGPEVIHLYPEYIGDASAYELLAAAQVATNDKPGAMATLTAYEKIGGQDPNTLNKLASLEEELNHPTEAAATLDRINYIYPELDGLHAHLGHLWLAQGNATGAIREFTAVLAMNPLDKATAQYDLAQAYMAAGQRDKAEESVLAALEAAPTFRPAQKLLVQLKAADTTPK
ncbi:MAG TPA: tetratricopeptide repeat protein [Granulicella sp.]